MSNRNEKHLTDFTQENIFTCLNTKFQKRKEKLWNYAYANNAKTQRDLMNKKWINSALNCETCSSFEGVSSDHGIVTAKIHLSQRRNASQTTKTSHYDWSMLNSRGISDKVIVVSRLLTTHTQNNKQTPFPRSDESLTPSANSYLGTRC